MTKTNDDPVSAADMADEHAALIMARDAMRAERDEARADLAECERQRVALSDEVSVRQVRVEFLEDENIAVCAQRDQALKDLDEARAERDQARDAQHQAELRGLRWQKLAGTLAQTIADLTANTAVDQ